jgi:catechol 2,3-dioxygenase-like lactoylglutathione lyase family enzyme
MKSKAFLEHANITVRNIEKAVEFIQTAMPEFVIRGGGGTGRDRWLHIGTDDTYIALEQGPDVETNNFPDYVKNDINHLGFVVNDINAVAERLIAAGYPRNYPRTEEKFRLREYFCDTDGNEYEFVQYLSDKISERNAYMS